MNDILQALAEHLEQGRNAVFCGIVDSAGSAPRTSGARMAVLPDGSIRGSVGGGALEGECMEAATELLAGGEQHRILSFNLSATKAADAGMVCGGAVKVLLQRVTPDQAGFFRMVDALHRAGRKPVLLTVMPEAGEPALTVWSADEGFGGMPLPAALVPELGRKAARTRQSFILEGEGVRVFAEPLVSPGVVHLVGAGHVALATAKVAAFAGFEVVVMDDRSEFANAVRYPEAREVRVLPSFDGCLEGLGPDDYVVIVTRGHLHDRDVLAQALRTRAGYVGMIGSRTKREAVYRSLLESGYSQADLDRVFCPIGLTIGADTPEEIAVSIVGEMIRVRAGLG